MGDISVIINVFEFLENFRYWDWDQMSFSVIFEVYD